MLRAAVVALTQRGLEQSGELKVSRSKRTGQPTVQLGTAITSEDVRALDDDE